MSLDPSYAQESLDLLSRAQEAGRAQGKQEAQADYYGKSARVLTGGLFAASLQAAASALRPHDAEAAAFFNTKAAEFQAWVTPPKVQTHEPADNATGIVVDNPISVKFVSPGVKPETVNQDTLYVTPASGGPHLAGVVAYDSSTCTASFIPSSPLSPGTQYKVTLDVGITATGGMTLGTAVVFTFTTGNGS